MTISNPQSLYQASGGALSSGPFLTVLMARDPAIGDIGDTGGQYPSGKRWINTVTNAEWYLNSFTSISGTVAANWQRLGALPFTGVETITGTGGTAVSPDALGNINLLGTNVTVAESPITHTLTLTAAGGTTLTFLTDTGTLLLLFQIPISHIRP